MKQAISAAYGAVVALVVTISYDQFFIKEHHWPVSAALTAAVAIGGVLLITYEVISESRPVTRRFSPISRVEGAWTIHVTNAKRPKSICQICLTHKEYVYKGYGLSPDGKLASEWNSRDVHYDEEQEEFSFTSDATILETGKRVRNYGYIKFFKNAQGRYVTGNGYFVDMADELSQSHMTLTRMSNTEFDKALTEVFTKTQE